MIIYHDCSPWVAWYLCIELLSSKFPITASRWIPFDICLRSAEEDKNKVANRLSSSIENRDHDYTHRQIKMKYSKNDFFDVEL